MGVDINLGRFQYIELYFEEKLIRDTLGLFLTECVLIASQLF